MTRESSVIIFRENKKGDVMKNRVPAILLAIGISASPVFAKQSNRRANNKDSSKIEEQKLSQKRAENSYKRQRQIELEKEFIKETELEIKDVLSDISVEQPIINKELRDDLQVKLEIKDSLPVNGIDITEEFLKIKNIRNKNYT